MSEKKNNICEANEEIEERRERLLDVLSGVLTVAAALAFLALCWLLIRIREAEYAERRAHDPQGAAARVERRLMAEDAAYRLCRRASGVSLALPKLARMNLSLVLED